MIFSKLMHALREALYLLGRPARRARARRGLVIQAYRGCGTAERVLLIGRVFRQSSGRTARGSWDLWGNLRDVARRLMRRSVPGATVRGSFYGAETLVETDADGYFHLEIAPATPLPEGRLWHTLDLALEGPQGAEAVADVFVPPAQARFAVVSDIDDTVMHTGVANKVAMMWRLFVQDAESRTAFPGVSVLYRAFHAGPGGTEANPMLYVSRAPWGIYDILDTFFRRHRIPVGPILFLREWGITWRSPLPRRAEDHKREVIERMMALYPKLPFILIGDSGQHDPEVYADIVAEHGDRVLAVYIRDVSPGHAGRASEIGRLGAAIREAGSHLVLAADTVTMAEDAAARGWLPAGTAEAVRRRIAGLPRRGTRIPEDELGSGPAAPASMLGQREYDRTAVPEDHS
ncbi:App1 family protein [Oceanicella sp. SM1341]|uniref:App1 family protein n=1 Tax=Oceanicella sp. SM1341 TaxID=1548889 RepID=UPI000E545B0B|nr:phosphatase domain-containing protein [Oceanicella sp. SM1341]